MYIVIIIVIITSLQRCRTSLDAQHGYYLLLHFVAPNAYKWARYKTKSERSTRALHLSRCKIVRVIVLSCFWGQNNMGHVTFHAHCGLYGFQSPAIAR